MKYIDAEKLKTEIERRINLISHGDTHPEVMKRVEGVLKGYNSILDFIDSLQQEQPEVDLEKEIEKMWNVFIETEAGRGAFSNIARHFYELGQQDKYQQDRAEFAKLKAKEWQDGYDDGYQRGLNARKEK